MLSQFYIVFESKELDSFLLKHIQYNIHKRLKLLKHITHRRFDLHIAAGKERAIIEWDDKKTSVVKCFVQQEIIDSCKEKRSIITIYNEIFNGLKILWEKNSWSIVDLENILLDVRNDDYFSSIQYGKRLASPDKYHKAEFWCEIFPEYSDYYVLFLPAKGIGEKKIKFLHGFQDPSIFFNFFQVQLWRDNQYFLLHDINKEIYFIFDVIRASFSIEYRPLNNSLEECQNYVNAFQAHVSHSERLRLLGLPK